MAKYKSILLFMLIGVSVNVLASKQIITTNNNYYNLTVGEKFSLMVYHNTDDINPKLSGLKLNLFYDNAKIELLNVDNILGKNNIGSDSINAITDTKNLDNNLTTNKYFTLAWLDFATINWLDSSTTKLYQVTFKTKITGNTSISFDGESTVGYDLETPSIILDIR